MLGALGFALVGLGAVLPVPQSELGVSPGCSLGCRPCSRCGSSRWVWSAVRCCGGSGPPDACSLAGALIVAGAALAALPAPRRWSLASRSSASAVRWLSSPSPPHWRARTPTGCVGPSPRPMRSVSVPVWRPRPPSRWRSRAGSGGGSGYLAPMALLATLGFGGWRRAQAAPRRPTRRTPPRGLSCAPHGNAPVLLAWFGVVPRSWSSSPSRCGVVSPSGTGTPRPRRQPPSARSSSSAGWLWVGSSARRRTGSPAGPVCRCGRSARRRGFAGFSSAVGRPGLRLVGRRRSRGRSALPADADPAHRCVGDPGRRFALGGGLRYGDHGLAADPRPGRRWRGLRWAYVLVPVLVVLLVIQQLAQHRSEHRHTAAGH